MFLRHFIAFVYYIWLESRFKVTCHKPTVPLHRATIIETEFLPLVINTFRRNRVRVLTHKYFFENMLVKVVFETVTAILHVFSELGLGELSEVKIGDISRTKPNKSTPHYLQVSKFFVNEIEIFLIICFVRIAFQYTYVYEVNGKWYYPWEIQIVTGKLITLDAPPKPKKKTSKKVPRKK